MSRPKKKSLSEVWEHCEPVFQGVLVELNKGLSQKKFMATYSLVFNYLCSASEFERSTNRVSEPDIYKLIRKLFQDYINGLNAEFQNLPNDSQLKFFRQKWEDFAWSRKLINGMLIYLNRTWIKSLEGQASIYPIHQLADLIWRDQFLIPNNHQLTQLVLNLIREQRDGADIDEGLIGSVTECYLRIGLIGVGTPHQSEISAVSIDGPKDELEEHLTIYREYFEKSLLEGTKIYYQTESTNYLQENGMNAFLRKAQRRLDEETNRSQLYLHSTTKPKIIQILRESLVSTHREAMYNQFVHYLEQESIEELKYMYNLLSLIADQGGLDPLKGQFQMFIQSVGEQKIAQNAEEASSKPDVFAELLLSTYREISFLIETCFGSDTDFIAARDKAFRAFITDNALTKVDSTAAVAKIPQLLAKYADLILKKGPFHISDSDKMEVVLNELVTIFSYLPDKDIFVMAYSKLLSRRLINDTSANDDFEVSMVSKLKTHQGFECGSKLQKMIQDMETSKDINAKFQNCRLELAEANTGETAGSKIDFKIYVLATSVWPISPPPTPFIIPKDLSVISDQFEGFYKKQHDGRKLCWLHHLSKLEIQCKTLMNGRLRLNTTVYQGAVLLCFNEVDLLKMHELTSNTGLNEQMLKVAILGMMKIGIIKASEKDHTAWNNDTAFKINNNFKSKKLRVNCNVPINLPNLRGGTETQHKTEVDSVEVRREREMKLQACLVRIMKTRKVANHNDLISEATIQVSKWFVPPVIMVKRVIEFLIEQEYLERVLNEDGSASKEYRYLA